MADMDIVLNSAGIKSLLRSASVLADLERRARRVAAMAGPGHEVESSVGRNRARASVRTETFGARRSEASSRSLTRAIEAGR